jgi:hypothetical protein
VKQQSQDRIIDFLHLRKQLGVQVLDPRAGFGIPDQVLRLGRITGVTVKEFTRFAPSLARRSMWGVFACG